MKARTWCVVALAGCGVLALRDAAAYAVGARLNPALRTNGVWESAAWSVAYYAMWALLTPGIFFLASRVRLKRDRWLRPVAFHLVVGVVVSASAPVALGILFGALVLGRGWPALQELLTPFWGNLAGYRAIADTLIYWLVLGAGTALLAYDEDQARRLLAAHLERSLVAAQVEVLKMKLQPHFLFNTLNSISVLALEQDAGAVAAMVERLGSLLRASMRSNGTQFVPVADEVALLEHYLAIEEVRFGDRLRVMRTISPGVVRALVPSLVLQPIIENSIKHGISRRIGAGRLEIAIDRDGDDLRVLVSDDGPGLSAGWNLETHCGRGLKNVIERLEALYRRRWSFTLRNGDSGGTIAELRIPYSTS